MILKMIHSTFCAHVPILEKKVLAADQVSMCFVCYKDKNDDHYPSVYKQRRRQKDGKKSTQKKI